MRAMWSSAQALVRSYKHEHDCLFGSNGAWNSGRAFDWNFDRNFNAVYFGKINWQLSVANGDTIAGSGITAKCLEYRGARLCLVAARANFHAFCHLDSEGS